MVRCMSWYGRGDYTALMQSCKQRCHGQPSLHRDSMVRRRDTMLRKAAIENSSAAAASHHCLNINSSTLILSCLSSTEALQLPHRPCDTTVG